MRFASLVFAVLPAALAMPSNPILTDPDYRPNPPGHPDPPKPSPNPPHHTTPTPTPPHHTTTSTTSTTSSKHTTSTSSTSTTTSTSTSTTTSTTSTTSSASSTSTAVPPSGVTIAGISYAGSGCTAGSVAGALSTDLSTITLLYDSFIAQAGPGLPPTEARTNCQLNIQLLLPQGWQFSVFKADYRGYAYIEAGDSGVVKATYYFSGDSTQVASQLTLKGAYDDNYLKEDEFGIESTVWSPCGEEGLLNINSEVRVSPLSTNNTALLTVDSTDFVFTQVHYLQWATC